MRSRLLNARGINVCVAGFSLPGVSIFCAAGFLQSNFARGCAYHHHPTLISSISRGVFLSSRPIRHRVPLAPGTVTILPCAPQTCAMGGGDASPTREEHFLCPADRFGLVWPRDRTRKEDPLASRGPRRTCRAITALRFAPQAHPTERGGALGRCISTKIIKIWLKIG